VATIVFQKVVRVTSHHHFFSLIVYYYDVNLILVMVNKDFYYIMSQNVFFQHERKR